MQGASFKPRPQWRVCVSVRSLVSLRAWPIERAARVSAALSSSALFRGRASLLQTGEHFFKQLNTASVSLQVLCFFPIIFFFSTFSVADEWTLLCFGFGNVCFFSKDKDGFTAPLRRYTQQGIV